MKDQKSIGKETPDVKYQRALDLFIESVYKLYSISNENE